MRDTVCQIFPKFYVFSAIGVILLTKHPMMLTFDFMQFIAHGFREVIVSRNNDSPGIEFNGSKGSIESEGIPRPGSF